MCAACLSFSCLSSTHFDRKEEGEEGGEKKGGALMAALTETQCLVRSKTEDAETQRERAEVVKAKSVHELSQITSLADIPIPMRGSSASAVERKKRFREK